MRTYLNNLISEKSGIDMDTVIEVEGASGTNFIPLECLADMICSAPKTEQKAIRSTLVRIDFCNGDVMHYFKHLAQAITL